MDVVGDHCVLVARTPATELVLIVVPLTHPKEAYTLQVSVSENLNSSFFPCISYLLIACMHVYCFFFFVLFFFYLLHFVNPLHH